MKKLILALFCVCLTTSFSLQAQVNSGILPKSSAIQLSDAIVPIIEVASPNVAHLEAKDAENSKDGHIFRVATVVPLSYDMYNAGIWEHTSDGYDVWRLRLHNSDAKGCCILFDNFMLPEGSQFFCYNTDKSLIYGPYTREDNESGEGYATGVFAKGDVILEYVSPVHQIGTANQPNITIAGYTYFYRQEGLPDLRVSGAKEYGESQSCMVNVNCPEGNNWRTQQRGIARMLSYITVDGEMGAGWCSGTLVNNTSGDGTPYFLSAFHCTDGTPAGYYNYTEFYFNYECISCNCTSEPGSFNTTGCYKRASGNIDGGSDFLLLELKNISWSQIKNNSLVFNGWNKSTSNSPSGVGIHHPAGDVKKISTYSTSTGTGTWHQGSAEAGASNAHWLVLWGTTMGSHHSVTEGGSSGSPLFNNNGLVVGTLTGGSATCNNTGTPDFFGKISYHWQSNGTTNDKRLKPWLDPVSLSDMTCNILDPNASCFVRPSAKLFTAAGGNVNFSIISNQAWTLSFDNDHSWFNVNTTSGSGTGTIQVTCNSNTESSSSRRCNMTVTFADGSTWKLVVKQEGNASSISALDETSSEFSVYPNPASSQITIQSDNNIIRTVEFIDMLGKVVYRYNDAGSNNVTLPVNQLEKAMYIIRITTNENQLIYKKFSRI